ncbi:MAG: 50S ribosomal protein L9 [Chloroflexota bacterium]|nr:50S ribosomal protein L9 [Chloroflexota bacterium]MDE2684255.1 50S ribosomal protein L9 [Chloroflexota bacterium]
MLMLFLRDVPDKARAGEVRRVSRGYARNYLLPKGLAEIATDETLKRLDKVKAEGDAERARETQVVEELAEALDNLTVTIEGRVTPTGRYYGAISGIRIADALGELLERDIDRRITNSVEPIREPGEYEVVLNLSSEIRATVNVIASIEE